MEINKLILNKKAKFDTQLLQECESMLFNSISTIVDLYGLNYVIKGKGFKNIVELLPEDVKEDLLKEVSGLKLNSTYDDTTFDDEFCEIKLNKLSLLVVTALKYINKQKLDQSYLQLIFMLDRIIFCIKSGYYLNFLLVELIERGQLSLEERNFIKQVVNKNNLTYTKEDRIKVCDIIDKHSTLEELKSGYVEYAYIKEKLGLNEKIA